MKNCFICIIILLMVLNCSSNESRAPLISAEDFFRNPQRTEVQLSPDGKHISYLQPWNKRLNIYKRYGKVKTIQKMPDLLDIQLKSFAEFLQEDVEPKKRTVKGLEEVFKSVFPIEGGNENKVVLEYDGYTLSNETLTQEQAKDWDMSYTVNLKAKLLLVNRNSGEVREDEVYMGDFPVMTDNGTFIINGAERVVVSQLHRSPGISFEETVHPSGKRLFSARLIPYRGAWIEFE